MPKNVWRYSEALSFITFFHNFQIFNIFWTSRTTKYNFKYTCNQEDVEEIFEKRKYLNFYVKLPEPNLEKKAPRSVRYCAVGTAACSRTIFKGRLLMSFCYPSEGSGNTAGRLCSVLHPFSVLSPRLFYLGSVSTFGENMAYRQVREYPLDVEAIRFLPCTGCFKISQIRFKIITY